MNVLNARYMASAVRADQYPAENLPEIAFIGRSNVGKSSLLNSLSRHNGLARTSGTPGKTQTINFYRLAVKRSEERREFYFVDLPGYGYARAGQASRRQWAKFIEEYLLQSPRLKLICQLIDIRHPPMESDIYTYRWLRENHLPVKVIATKSDKISRSALKQQVMSIKTGLELADDDILAYSSVNGLGRLRLLDAIGDLLLE
ncbi:MAG: ribosome biogenesis GTP-binding protein YihA/YsxC [Veillonellales bacterium]